MVERRSTIVDQPFDDRLPDSSTICLIGRLSTQKVFLDRKEIPSVNSPSLGNLDLICQLVDLRQALHLLLGAGKSVGCGQPGQRSDHVIEIDVTLNIAKQEFVRSIRARRRYWARSYAGWRRFISAQPGAGHMSLATLEKVGRVNFMITQNVDRLHHRAGSDPLELHGTVYTVVCLNCGTSIDRNAFQDQVKALNIKWAAAVESLEHGDPGSDKNFGMQQRPDGDIEIDEKFWEQDFVIPDCDQCGGMLKPDVVFFGDNVPKDRAEKAMEAAKSSDAFLVLGSSLMTMSAFRLVRAAHEAKADVAIVNIGGTRADDFAPLKISARVGEILSVKLLYCRNIDIRVFHLIAPDPAL
ncbi:NAD-dependent protein deacetylase SRT2 [Platanthera zijinensis]|uniref:NAD-dependent protein deacetylase SRT2 n=1 Tax=Platanthera zijinensis TaxID=2320716 RepID=A0AAP0G2D8_9ASPA